MVEGVKDQKNGLYFTSDSFCQVFYIITCGSMCSSKRCTNWRCTSNYALALEDGALALAIFLHFECQEFGDRDTKVD
jgi:hypothetical protein